MRNEDYDIDIRKIQPDTKRFIIPRNIKELKE